jgi:hypothetical protein
MRTSTVDRDLPLANTLLLIPRWNLLLLTHQVVFGDPIDYALESHFKHHVSVDSTPAAHQGKLPDQH